LPRPFSLSFSALPFCNTFGSVVSGTGRNLFPRITEGRFPVKYSALPSVILILEWPRTSSPVLIEKTCISPGPSPFFNPSGRRFGSLSRALFPYSEAYHPSELKLQPLIKPVCPEAASRGREYLGAKGKAAIVFEAKGLPLGPTRRPIGNGSFFHIF
jgi:hypothetical protein